ncbi:putative transcription factor ssDNA-binding-TF family [Helianthus debilis subsp. tardiflorus]
MLNLSIPSTPIIQNPKTPFCINPQISSLPSIKLLNPISRKLSLKCQYSDQQQQRPDVSSYSQPRQDTPKVFIGHSIYKGKAALTVEPRPPEFAPLDSGAFKLTKEGFILLQFAPAAGVRQYDWSRKQVFSLSVTEIGSIISLGARDSCEFFHDPFKGKSDEGRVRKVLKVEPLPDGSGHFFNLSVQNKLINMDESIYIPVTKAEFAILISAFNFAVPYLLGWHTFVNSIKPEGTAGLNNANSRFGADLEWSR